MESASVYIYLQEIFPQIDARLLKAVAIENSNNADAAVEVVLSEILPYVSAKSPIGSSGSQSTPDYTGYADEQRNSSERLNTSPVEFPSPLDDGAPGHMSSSSPISPVLIVDGGTTFWDANDAIDDESCENFRFEEPTTPKTAKETTVVHFEQTSQSNALVSSSITKVSGEVHDTIESEELILLGMTGSTGKPQGKSGKLLIDLNESADDVDASTIINDVTGPQTHDYDLAISCQQDCYTFPEIVDLVCQKSSPSVQGSPSTLCQRSSSDILFEGQAHHDATISEMGELDSYTFPEIVDLVCHKSSDTASVQKNNSAAPSSEDRNSCRASAGDDFSEINNSESESVFGMDITRSPQTVEVDLLEQIIEDSKSNKKTLFSAMESVIKTMKEVEEEERAAERVKEEAALAGLDCYSKIEELRNTLARAKETNDMHSGEVYGERAILATEVRELQSRLLCLSDERDNSLAILDKMRTSLENRLAVAEKLRHEFECEKLVKEESALLALREEEALMEKVVQESKRLQKEAEENTKLQEFLMDRGRVVDVLQGEIAVICQDVKLLKEKFDSGVALSESISSVQTTCKLASSSSSFNSDRAEVLKTPNKVLSHPSPDNGSKMESEEEEDSGRRAEEETVVNGRWQGLLEGGWELCV